MTGEEAIEFLEKEKIYMIGHGGNRQAMALDMAIKAVNEESFKNTCIKQASKERDSILDKIKAEIKEKFEGYDICEWFEDYDYEENNISEYRSVGNIGEILDIIDKYKESVTPTCKKGHWIEVDTNMYTCSNCSHCFEIVPEVNSIHQFKCCPNCKTEMESDG